MTRTPAGQGPEGPRGACRPNQSLRQLGAPHTSATLGPGTSPLFNLVQDSELEPQVRVVLKAGCCRSEPRAQAASGRPGRGCPANGGAASCPGSGPTPSEPLAGGLPVAVKVRGPGRVPAGRNPRPREKQTIRTAPDSECTPSLSARNKPRAQARALSSGLGMFHPLSADGWPASAARDALSSYR
jgi:hypothetical protein